MMLCTHWLINPVSSIIEHCDGLPLTPMIARRRGNANISALHPKMSVLLLLFKTLRKPPAACRQVEELKRVAVIVVGRRAE
jgi:hypothetical protein